MKIIGKTKSGWIVDASEYELLCICGYDYESDRRTAVNSGRGYNSNRGAFELGDDIQVAAIWSMLKNIQSYERKLIEAKATLAAVINGVDMVVPVVKAVAEFESEVSPADEVSRL